jgi:hypothetical protein
MIFLSCFEPTLDRILRVLDGFELRIAVGHTARKVRHCREKASAILSGKGLNNHSIFRTLAHSLSQLRKKATSFLIYIGLMGRLKGIVRISRLPGLDTL